MSLENLLKIGQLKAHPPDAAEVQRLLDGAAGSLADARIAGISPEGGFILAYKAVTQAALAALMAHGYRPDTNRPGHHATMVQGLALTIGLAPTRVKVLDTLRRTRNLADYTGEDVDDSSTGHCIAEAERLLHDVKAWLAAHRPELVAPRK